MNEIITVFSSIVEGKELNAYLEILQYFHKPYDMQCWLFNGIVQLTIFCNQIAYSEILTP